MYETSVWWLGLARVLNAEVLTDFGGGGSQESSTLTLKAWRWILRSLGIAIFARNYPFRFHKSRNRT